MIPADFAVSKSDLLQTTNTGTPFLWKTGSDKILKRNSVESAIVLATLDASTTYKMPLAELLCF
jgi:hypothetical protein